MCHRFSASFAACLLFAALASQVHGNELDESERIIGGQDAQQGMFPWTVALFYNDQFICTASVISPTDVLTAAHCVVFDGVVQPASSYYGIAGNVNKSSPVYRINFSGLTPHPDYGTTFDNDLAIFRASEPIPISDNLKPICIAAPDSDAEYRTAIAMGWGRTNRIRILPTQIPDILQYANQRIVPNTQCQAIYGPLNDMKLCATGLFTGVCNGDSGGPLVHLRDDTPIEIGIVSYGNAIIGCGKTLGPAVFTRVSSYNDFITQTANDVCVA
ncbi:chymotrypsin-like protease CTRL-1 [Uloborus diversus]|uniref:chymotrypsin-like protease CTRL-1 n=1 Tax=Uloborus diversus TaxID=327109 RepID=UPI0024094241|nr:chymotrypsin-like protease CTRL-1 [Uloborus diversus]